MKIGNFILLIAKIIKIRFNTPVWISKSIIIDRSIRWCVLLLFGFQGIIIGIFFNRLNFESSNFQVLENIVSLQIAAMVLLYGLFPSFLPVKILIPSIYPLFKKQRFILLLINELYKPLYGMILFFISGIYITSEINAVVGFLSHLLVFLICVFLNILIRRLIMIRRMEIRYKPTHSIFAKYSLPALIRIYYWRRFNLRPLLVLSILFTAFCFLILNSKARSFVSGYTYLSAILSSPLVIFTYIHNNAIGFNFKLYLHSRLFGFSLFKKMYLLLLYFPVCLHALIVLILVLSLVHLPPDKFPSSISFIQLVVIYFSASIILIPSSLLFSLIKPIEVERALDIFTNFSSSYLPFNLISFVFVLFLSVVTLNTSDKSIWLLPIICCVPAYFLMKYLVNVYNKKKYTIYESIF